MKTFIRILFLLFLFTLCPLSSYSQKKPIKPPKPISGTGGNKPGGHPGKRGNSGNRGNNSSNNNNKEENGSETEEVSEEDIYGLLQLLSEETEIYSNNVEIINGIEVEWSDAASEIQKEVIRELLNNLVFVEGGSYKMGSDDYDAYMEEKPVHTEQVSSFYIDRFEVIQKLWKAIMKNNPSHFQGDYRPVESINFYDCQQFIKRLNELTGLSFRLPTEAEWEYAARGGHSGGYKYSGSNYIDNVAWNSQNSEYGTEKVGFKSPNELGIYDMSGNVWEWTADNYSHDYNSPRNNTNYVQRGGSFANSPRLCRVSVRVYDLPANSRDTVGFRIVLDYN